MKTVNAENIVSITQQGILYKDDQEEPHWIELSTCNKNYCETRRNLIEPDFETVGKHHVAPNYIELFTNPPIRFDFENSFQDEPDQHDERFIQVVELFDPWFLRYDIPKEVPVDGH